ncbi:uncharacterized protein EDB91DRAFT_1161210 [Suillus paluster]|uniref:uncharacterized protein n=1 Tax=Suillus paluster TaxID=48578 RepID=UPI001B85D741|nr:uncharacterized protein EDB91DRAFT_1161210 [Suillus paluster]KAG1728596.1 hypothetical protein EDB91DRAFT_1161210 [Suillus paluster]
MHFIFLAIVAALTASMSVSATPAVVSKDSRCFGLNKPCNMTIDDGDCCTGYYCHLVWRVYFASSLFRVKCSS